MSNRVRFVFDTNAIISALLFVESKPGQAFLAALSIGDVLLSLETLQELSDVLSRKKFDRYLTQEDRELFLENLLERAILIDVAEEIRACRDPKDDKFLALAMSGGAAFIVSGDADLLELNPFQGIPILNAEEFLQVLREP